MKSYRLPSREPVEQLDDTPYEVLPSTADLKRRLDDAKTLLDGPSRDPRWLKVSSITDYYRSLRYVVGLKYNARNVSNAWLKMYELITYYGLVTSDTKWYFANSEMPGSFILAFNHYNQTRNGGRTKWIASSIYGVGDPQKNYLDDRYLLYKNYPQSWLMGNDNNGDTTIPENIRNFRKKILEKTGGKLVDLYTSDAGIDVSSEGYNDQERIEAKINLGQIAAGLATLAPGGHFVVKTFMYFEPFSISLLRILTGLFNEFYISKPMTSRPSNSEVYWVGKGFRGVSNSVLDALLNRLENFNMRPFVSKKFTYDDTPWMDVVLKSYEIFENQIESLRENVSMYEKYRDDIPKLVNLYKNRKNIMINKYLRATDILVIDDDKNLKSREEILKRKNKPT
jgi:hypothetical protein